MYRIGVRGRGTVHRPLLLPLLPVGFLLLLAAVALASSPVALPFFPLLYVALPLALRLPWHPPWHAGAWRPSAAARTTARQALPADGIDQENELLGAMERRGGITAARAALETSLSVAAAEEMLSGLASDGHLRVGVYGGAAVATCHQSQAGEFQGNDVTGEFRATLIFAEQEGRWLLAGLHLSPIAGAPSFLNR